MIFASTVSFGVEVNLVQSTISWPIPIGQEIIDDEDDATCPKDPKGMDHDRPCVEIERMCLRRNIDAI